MKISSVTEYFRVNFNFHEPYEVILDGNFTKLLVERNPPFLKRLEQILNGKVFPKVTDCVLNELQILGDQFKYVLAEAKKQQIIRCRHIFGTSPRQCISDLIGPDNSKKYMVCSQDIELRRVVRELMNVPIFYFGPDQRITMEDVNKRNKEVLKEQTKDKLKPQEYEYKHIKAQKEEEDKESKERLQREMLKVAGEQGLKLPGKKARAPNPLSMKKKQRKD